MEPQTVRLWFHRTTQKINNNTPERGRRREGEGGGKKRRSVFIEKLSFLSHISPGGTFLRRLFPVTRKEGKTRRRNETTTGSSPPTKPESPPTLRNSPSPFPLYSTPLHPPTRPSIPPCSPRRGGLFLKMLLVEASLLRELLIGSEGSAPVQREQLQELKLSKTINCTKRSYEKNDKKVWNLSVIREEAKG